MMDELTFVSGDVEDEPFECLFDCGFETHSMKEWHRHIRDEHDLSTYNDNGEFIDIGGEA